MYVVNTTLVEVFKNLLQLLYLQWGTEYFLWNIHNSLWDKNNT